MLPCDFQGRIYSVDSAKAIKAQYLGWLNGIQYMAPSTKAGVGNLCSHASPECIKACLGWESGQASLVAFDEALNDTRKSRIAKARAFMRDRVRFMRRLVVESARVVAEARRKRMKPCLRPNGSQDIAFEGIRIDVDEATVKACARLGVHIKAGIYRNLFEVFPDVQFVDYTKNPHRLVRQSKGAPHWPSNYYLTFSRSETNEAEALDVLRVGGNVAIVFGDGLPETWHGFTVINGDEHDLRHLDPRGGYVVGLSPKGLKAKRDYDSGFVVWTDPTRLEAARAKRAAYLASQERRKARVRVDYNVSLPIAA